MIRSLVCISIAIMLIIAPTFAAGQEATPAPACPEDQYPAIGALDLSRGDVEWSVCSSTESYRTVLGVTKDVVIIEESGPEGRFVSAVDPGNGAELWRRPTTMMVVTPGGTNLDDVMVLAVVNSGQPALIGVSTETGMELWRIQSSEFPVVHGATITIIGGALQPTGPSPLRGIDRKTGEEVWRSDLVISDLSGASVGRTSSTELGGIAILPTGETISAINLLTGDLLWNAPYLAHVVSAEGIVVGIEGGDRPGSMITALDLARGERLWTSRGTASYGGFLAVGDGVAVVLGPDRHEVIAYELTTGTERWRTKPLNRVEPQLSTGEFVVALWEGTITVLSTSDGTTVWTATLPFRSPWMNSVGTNGDTIIVAINSLPWSD